MRRLYGRTTTALMSTDDFLVITMEAAAGLPFDEIIKRLWLTLNDGKPIPDDWEAAAWPLRAFMAVCFFHRAYLACPEPILRLVLKEDTRSGPDRDVAANLTRLNSQDGWLLFRLGEHARPYWAYQGTPVFTAHQRIARRAWEYRPLGWVNIGEKIVQASLIAPQSVKSVGQLAARLCFSDEETDRSFAARLIAEWSSTKNQPSIPTRYLYDLVAALQVNGQRQLARQFQPELRVRATSQADGWLAALSLAFLRGDSVAM